MSPFTPFVLQWYFSGKRTPGVGLQSLEITKFDAVGNLGKRFGGQYVGFTPRLISMFPVRAVCKLQTAL
eukprot:1154883-Pelagomonas_calceolata.AAC.1